MKGFLLAGGRGERLRPLTLSTPKCLVPINGTPLLGIWLDLLDRQGVDDVLLNVSHHVEQVQAFLRARPRGPRVRLVCEDRPAGNAGTVAANRWFVERDDQFWVFYADNLTNVFLGPMLDAHGRHDGVLTVGLFHAPDPRAAGIVTTDGSGRIVDFVEKPVQPRGDLANAGIYLARASLFDHLPPNEGVLDFGHDVFPHLVGRMYGHLIEDFLMDVGTPTALERAASAWARLGAGGTRP
jgi:mannose-1-phosphate guanylyltransferase